MSPTKLRVSFPVLLAAVQDRRAFRVEQGEKLKRQASETGDKLKHAAKDAKKQVEKRSEGLGDKLFSILMDVKKSVFGKKPSLA